MSTEWKTTQDPNNKIVINYSESVTKPPPLLEVGALAWIRKNLFGSIMDIFLTIFGAIFIFIVVSTAVSWIVRDANWLAITLNFRQFMLGQFERDYEWRIVVFMVFIALTVGVTLAAYVKRLSSVFIVSLTIVFASIFILPILIDTIIDLPPTYFAAGNVDIISGSAIETAQPQLAFIAKEGEKITFRLASDLMASDNALSELHGFADVASNTLKNAAQSHINNLSRVSELQTLLANDQAEIAAGQALGLLTENQRTNYNNELARLLYVPGEEEQLRIDELTAALNDADLSEEDRIAYENERAELQASPGIIETYNLANLPVAVTVLEVDMLVDEQGVYSWDTSIVLEKTLTSGDAPVSFVAPDDGWYVWQKSIVDGEGVAILEAQGVFPIVERGSLTGDSRYIRFIDDFVVFDQAPEINDESVPYTVITRTQYRGSRPWPTYLRIYLAPFLRILKTGTLVLLIAGMVGYWGARFADKTQSKSVSTKRMKPYALRASNWMLITAPVLMFILVNGFAINVTLLGALAVIVSVVLIFVETGEMPDTESSGPIFIVIWFLNFFWRRFSTPKKMILAAVWLAFIVGFLLDVNIQLVGYSDPRRWGGLLLAMVLTVFGIMFAFPLGLALALGRRSQLPAVKVVCTLIIELVRGSPFITVLFMMQLMVPLISPAFAEIPNAYRALFATVIFIAAYLAENVRGGLQSLPPGQEEAAKALGLSNFQSTLYITLPQALRAVIPALVGQFISLFKDTSLVAIVGLIDLTGIVNTVVVQAEFIGTRREGLIFITIIYFMVSYVMSYVSRQIEASGSGAARRI